MSTRAWRWLAAGAVALVGLEIALQMLWPYVDDNDPVPTLENQLALLAALVLLALPHAIAVLGYRGRPALLKVAGAVALLLGIATLLPITTAAVGIPLLLVPSFFYFVASRGAGAGGRVATPVLVVVAGFCALGAAAAFFVTQDPRCEVTVREPGGSTSVEAQTCDLTGSSGRLGVREISWSGTSDVIAFHESLPSLALSLGAFAFCAWGSAARDGRHRPA
ncbi:MAG: hypothetical protein M3323_05860 [Actinomycetota bacterium]|nr:hypothetical protein [Actinomycetota bacterium]